MEELERNGSKKRKTRDEEEKIESETKKKVKVEHVSTFTKNGKSVTICNDFNKKDGCKQASCRYKAGHVCSVKGCHKPRPCHDHQH